MRLLLRGTTSSSSSSFHLRRLLRSSPFSSSTSSSSSLSPLPVCSFTPAAPSVPSCPSPARPPLTPRVFSSPLSHLRIDMSDDNKKKRLSPQDPNSYANVGRQQSGKYTGSQHWGFFCAAVLPRRFSYKCRPVRCQNLPSMKIALKNCCFKINQKGNFSIFSGVQVVHPQNLPCQKVAKEG